MKAIFLDIDGVLNSSRSVFVKIGPTIYTDPDLSKFNEKYNLPAGAAFALKAVDPICVALLNRLIDNDTALVLSSTHRLHFRELGYGSENHLRVLREYLALLGIRVPSRFDVTPVLHRHRGEEIDSWIFENHFGFDAEIHNWVILDDSADMLPYQPFVQVNADAGLSFSNYADACQHLGLKEPSIILI